MLRLVLSVLVTLSALICTSWSKKPNILFIVSDDLGYDDVGFQSGQILTPNIDNFRLNGQFLEWYYGQCVCSATRSVFLTGRYPLHTGVNGWIHPTDAYGVPLSNTFLSTYLKNNNYDTHAVGKWHLGFYKWDYTPTFRGFNSFYGYYTGGEDYFTHVTNDYYDFRNDSSPMCGANCSQVATEAYGHYSPQMFTDAAIDAIKKYNASGKSADNDEPLFLYLAYQSVHSPAEVLPRYEDIYGYGNATTNPIYISDSTRRKFAGMVTCMDEGIGNVTDALKKYGLFDDNLIVIFSSDNGGPIPGDDGGDDIGARNWPLKGGKHSIWEGGTRLTSLIWSTPDIIPRNLSTINGNYSQLMHAADWYPTILDAAGISYNATALGLDGVSQWDGILGKLDEAHANDNHVGARFDFRDNIYYGRNAYSEPANNTAYQYQGLKLLNSSGGVPDYWYAPVSSDVAPSYESEIERMMAVLKDELQGTSNMSAFQLYNLTNDPTEHHDISDTNSTLVAVLAEMMVSLQATGIPQAQNDPTCNSTISHPTYPTVGGVWEPWC